MPIMLMRLRGVPEDEAQEVRELLQAHRLDVYETPPDLWGVSMPAIWLRDESQTDEAKRLIEDYHEQRRGRARNEQERLRREGLAETFTSRVWRQPVRTLIFLVLAAGVLYFSIKPFLALGG